MAGQARGGICLALGGGGARGFAHVGVLEVLHRQGVAVRGIVGTSSGAIAGAGYALGYHPDQMVERVLEFAASPLAKDPRVRAMVSETQGEACRSLGDRVGRLFCKGRLLKNLVLDQSVLGLDYFRAVVAFFLPDVMIEACRVPFAAVATDVQSGRTVIIDKGPLREAVVASSAVPGVAPAVRHQGRALIDGGVCSLVPTLEARRMGMRPLVAVCVDRDIVSDALPKLGLELYLRAGDIQAALLSELMLKQADLVLRPAVGGMHWMDHAQASAIMAAGRREAELRLPSIERLAQDRLGDRLGRAWRAARSAMTQRRTSEA
ncbi:MAG: patatin-like phospholipase family protein [Thermodesulfobacteriota bacterium]